ncbi:MAG TPA: glycosyltransferase family 29 protein [Planctomycetota bacterium]|nr:glycosyltransferase family 29 protein [Planctomycetota bacterium]
MDPASTPRSSGRLLKQLDVQAALSVLSGKRVAVVGNSGEVLKGSHGSEIDAHDIVIRMNAGVPGFVEGAHGRALGHRTDILAAARLLEPERVLSKSTPKFLWWMKRTKLGRVDLEDVKRSPFLLERDVWLWDWPESLEREVHQFVGSPPSTGIRVLHAVCKHSDATEVSSFGMSWWGLLGGSSRNTWRPSREGPDPAHDPRKECRAFWELGFLPVEEGWYAASTARR